VLISGRALWIGGKLMVKRASFETEEEVKSEVVLEEERRSENMSKRLRREEAKRERLSSLKDGSKRREQ